MREMVGDADPDAKTIVASPAASDTHETLDDRPTRVAERYELLGLLGAGAMGTVYRARDRELDETIALKVLKKELGASPGMLDRFRREVKLARRVTHRNVARVFDIGEQGGDRFLTMEFIDGEMLGALVARRGALPVAEVLAIARDVCAGLSAAHAAGVLHRDLKPENVILARDGRAVLTDFGIARALEDLARTASVMVGTPAYMAPEQVEGTPDLDARADLYALGTMLFELLTGAMAWPGDSIVTIAAGRLLKPPPDVRSINPTLPPSIAELVLRLMARERDDRPASADEVATAIAKLTADAARISIPPSTMAFSRRASTNRTTVAILPLLNLGDGSDEYLAGNLTEDLVDLLSMVQEIRVRPRGETARFSDPERDAREVGRSLGVRVVVDGALRRIGDAVRVSVRLVTVEDGFQLWARRFDRPASEVLTIADDAARAIAHALTTELSVERRNHVTDPVAQDLFLRGRFLIHRGWFEVHHDALQYLREARERAPGDGPIAATYALALARAASASDGPDSLGEARIAIEQARAIDPEIPEVGIALGLIELQNQDVATAVTHFRRVVAASPMNAEALDWLGRLLFEVGRIEPALDLARRAIALDPTLLHARFHIARMRSLFGDREAMLEELGPQPSHIGDLMPWLLIQARDLLWRRDVDGAKALMAYTNKLDLSQRGMSAVKGMLSMTATGRVSDEQRAAIDALLPMDVTRPPRRACFNAQIQTELAVVTNRLDDAERALRATNTNRLTDLLWMTRCPLLDPLKGTKTFAQVSEATHARVAKALEAVDAPL
jgi:eukaryotic-like serine/threonine-protein kinase